MSLCHVRLLSARASFLPSPSPPTPTPSHSNRGRRTRASPRGERCTCRAGAGGSLRAGGCAEVGPSPPAPAPGGLLVGEAVGVGEELLRGEPILRHVAGAAADQVVRHAAGRHRDPT